MTLTFRPAVKHELETLVSLLSDDPIGRHREDTSQPLNNAYDAAFQAIAADPNNLLLVAELDGQLVGMMQLTFIPYLTHTGSWRCLVEGVRVHNGFRGRGIGAHMFAHAITQAKERGCRLVQLTSDKQRPDAIRFYEKLGFQASHQGFKLVL